MKLISQIKLLPTPEQVQALQATMIKANEACNYLSKIAWDNKTFNQYALHKCSYYDCRSKFGLSAQMVIGCLAKVADAYKLDRKKQRHFRPFGAITYDSRILRFDQANQFVSIWTVSGRVKIPFVCGQRQASLLQNQQGESDLCLVKGKYLLNATCEVAEPTKTPRKDVLGVDLGIVNLATDSTGAIFSGEQIEKTRKRYLNLRSRLQSCGSKSAKRHLKKLAKKQKRFQKNTNHVISKHLVWKAKAQAATLCIEELKGIGKVVRKRLKPAEEKKYRLRKSQRARHSNWAFGQLRAFISYKATYYGVAVRSVSARYTSQRCSSCGHIEKRNRKSQSHFSCVSCSNTMHADYNAALNIKFLGLSVNQPTVSTP